VWLENGQVMPRQVTLTSYSIAAIMGTNSHATPSIRPPSFALSYVSSYSEDINIWLNIYRVFVLTNSSRPPQSDLTLHLLDFSFIFLLLLISHSTSYKIVLLRPLLSNSTHQEGEILIFLSIFRFSIFLFASKWEELNYRETEPRGTKWDNKLVD